MLWEYVEYHGIDNPSSRNTCSGTDYDYHMAIKLTSQEFQYKVNLKCAACASNGKITKHMDIRPVAQGVARCFEDWHHRRTVNRAQGVWAIS